MVTFVTGLDLGTSGRLLDDFREFLVLKADGGANLVWWALILTVILERDHAPIADEDEHVLIDGLWDLLDEAAELLHTSPAGVMDLVAQRRLRPMRAGHTLMFARSDIEQLAIG
ncbi:helix-turn-helix domain-containing protein [Amycolatopsis speibonae]|uniref:Helix-turn-helix domain-containing protein n=1 Tax=Amycolatopsis speibonae TaxID=1450224 RepID=A0ABV7P5C9_9PSEU